MLRKRWFWIVIAVVVLAGGSYAAYRLWFAPKQVAETEATVKTGTVTVGSFSITAAGSGTLLASQEANLAFSTVGEVETLLVEVGDRVKAGDVLATIDDSAARQAVAAAEAAVLQAQEALAVADAEAKLAAAQAEMSLAEAQSALDDLKSWSADDVDVQLAAAQFVSAQTSYYNTVKRAGLRDEELLSTRYSLESAISALADAQEAYANAMSPDRDYERNIESTRENAAAALTKAQQNLELAQASYDLNSIDSSASDVQTAKANLLSAQTAYEEAQTPPDAQEVAAAEATVQLAAISVEQAQFALTDHGEGETVASWKAQLALEEAEAALVAAEDTLEGARLVAPFDSTVTAVNAAVGDTPAGTVIVLANLDTPIVQFWVEETELQNMGVGKKVNMVFDALPDYLYTGEIYRIDPMMVSVANVSAIQAWATIDVSANPVELLADMNVTVEVVAGEALNALLVPVEALREIGDGYGVFVQQPNGELELRTVEVGLIDVVYAEIKSGLEAGETVTLAETAGSSSVSIGESSIDTGMPGMPSFEGGGVFIGGGGGMP